MAAEDAKTKKRKGASDSAPKAKKAKKTDDPPAVTKAAKVTDPAPTIAMSAEPKPAKKKAVRKQAVDFFSDNETAPPTTDPAKPVKAKKGKTEKTKATPQGDGEAIKPAISEEAAPVKSAKPKKGKKEAKSNDTADLDVVETSKPNKKKAKKGKQAETKSVEDNEIVKTPSEATTGKVTKAKKSQKQGKLVEDTIAEPDVVEDVEEDDQTAALLAGFESDGDQEDPEEDVGWGEDAGIHSYTKMQRNEMEKAVKAEKASKSNEPGVVYVGRVPRGFFEAQMKKYFSQFGTVTRLRLSRNKKTGAPKHYAFIEFASVEVAVIVARTMNNYLMYGHILKSVVVPPEQVHPDLFKGAGQRFKVDPRNKKAGLEMERGVPRDQWEKRVEKETKRRAGRAKQLKENLGYEYTPSKLKSVDDVPIQTLSLEDQEQQKLLAEIPAEETSVTEQVKEKKKAKGKAKANKTNLAVDLVELVPSAPEPKGKKASKTKVADEAKNDEAPLTEPSDPVPTKKAKKAKQRKSNAAVQPDAAVTEDTKVSKPAAGNKKAKTVDVSAEATKEKKRKVDPEQKGAPKPKKAKKATA